MDYDSAVQQYQLGVEVTDGPSTVDVTVAVEVTNVNEYSPSFPESSLIVIRDEGDATPVGSIIANMAAVDADYPPDGVVRYTFHGKYCSYNHCPSV